MCLAFCPSRGRGSSFRFHLRRVILDRLRFLFDRPTAGLHVEECHDILNVSLLDPTKIRRPHVKPSLSFSTMTQPEPICVFSLMLMRINFSPMWWKLCSIRER